jgi:hypothetical protein
MIQERYHNYITRKLKEEREMSDPRELREDHMDTTSLNAAINHYALTHDMTAQQVQAMIQESPQARQLVMSFFWEKNTL